MKVQAKRPIIMCSVRHAHHTSAWENEDCSINLKNKAFLFVFVLVTNFCITIVPMKGRRKHVNPKLQFNDFFCIQYRKKSRFTFSAETFTFFYLIKKRYSALTLSRETFVGPKKTKPFFWPHSYHGYILLKSSKVRQVQFVCK